MFRNQRYVATSEEHLRIAIVAPPWIPVPPNGYGGTEAVIDRLALGLKRAGHEVLLVGHPDSTCPVDLVRTKRLPPGTEIGEAAFELRHAVEAYRRLCDRRIDVIHDHTVAGPLLAPQIAPAPVVTTNHGTFDDHVMPLYVEIARRVPVLAISRSQAAQAVGLTPLAVIHHGLDVTASPLGAGAGGYFAYLGRMNPTKGVHVAIDVARRAGVPLLIAAKMRERREHEYFRERVEPLLGGDVEYIGEVGAAAKHRLLADAVALLNPICWPEPFGMVMVEALACGTPVVAFRNGAAPEIVEHGVNGLLCATVEEMVEAVPLAATIDRAACRCHAEEHFSSERMVDEHVAVYRALANLHGGRPASKRPVPAAHLRRDASSGAAVEVRRPAGPVTP